MTGVLRGSRAAPGDVHVQQPHAMHRAGISDTRLHEFVEPAPHRQDRRAHGAGTLRNCHDPVPLRPTERPLPRNPGKESDRPLARVFLSRVPGSPFGTRVEVFGAGDVMSVPGSLSAGRRKVVRISVRWWLAS
jgi:hypothetical protein